MAPRKLSTLPLFETIVDAEPSETLAGKYAVRGQAKSIVARDGLAIDAEWFTTPPLSGTILNQLTSIQLFTESHDQGWASNVTAGNWTWFGLQICQKAQGGKVTTKKLPTGQLLAWRSHKNPVLSTEYTWRKGQKYTRDDDLLKQLKPGDVISVRICARFANWKNDAKSGCLVIGLSGDPYFQDPIDCRSVGDKPSPSIIACARRQDECLMLPVQGSAGKNFETTVVRGGVDLMGRLLENHGIYWSVHLHPLVGSGEEAEPSAMKSMNFRTLLELSGEGSQPGAPPTVRPYNLRNQTATDISSNQSQPSPDKPKIILLDDHGVNKDGVEMPTYTDADLLVYQMSAPLWRGRLWKEASKGPKSNGIYLGQDRLIVVIDADDLRKEGMQLSRQISWEKTMEDFRTHFFRKFPEIKQSSMHLLVRCSYEGVFYVKKGPGFNCYVVPDKAEGDLVQSHSGLIPGIATAFMTGLAASLVNESSNSLARLCDTHIETAVTQALNWAHLFASTGFRREPGGGQLNYPSAKDVNLDTKARTIVISCGSKDMGKDGKWSMFTILQDVIQQMAANIVRRTPKVIKPLAPTAQFGALLTADRVEIECFRATAAAVQEYLSGSLSRPLSIGVFGPPGSGKSFGVTQVIKAMTEGRGIKSQLLEVNLSQFLAYSDLKNTFRAIRDILLSGRIPVVLFDEFDSFFEQELGWLKYFLAPMQDGYFLSTGATRPLGRAIFVFIGGTSHTFQHFADANIDADADIKKSRLAKKPDFVSRLSAYIDIRGPSQIGGSQGDDEDPMYPIRRAIIFRAMLEKRLGSRIKEFEIDDDLLRAILTYPVLQHGARSLDVILQTSSLSGRQRFDPAALPSDDQLGMHVDVAEFLKMIDSDPNEPDSSGSGGSGSGGPGPGGSGPGGSGSGGSGSGGSGSGGSGSGGPGGSGGGSGQGSGGSGGSSSGFIQRVSHRIRLSGDVPIAGVYGDIIGSASKKDPLGQEENDWYKIARGIDIVREARQQMEPDVLLSLLQAGRTAAETEGKSQID